MLKVRCNMCANEVKGFCTKKTQSSKPVKIKLNKPRVCNLYKEDPMRVLEDYRKREAHKKKLFIQEQQRIQLAQTLNQVQTQLTTRKEELKDEDL